ncbi:putative protein ABIL2 isoform X3 [Hordeum vulgare subsp. vulgare]|uniref:putative protein ABIL2 isoform X3 n=1 Tax=Hordeum vulgare subsp. vulgare TaxID=112509 RepID=UPI001D1A5B38|nr:putative protein ABIL2 isoform X3 [Hordeum vulgare subsp. vulgare]
MVEAAGPFRRRGGTMEEVRMEEAFIFSETIKVSSPFKLRPCFFSSPATSRLCLDIFTSATISLHAGSQGAASAAVFGSRVFRASLRAGSREAGVCPTPIASSCMLHMIVWLVSKLPPHFFHAHRVMSNLKEYAVKALVNTVDHLGSISFKVSSLVDQRFDEVAQANLRVSCIQQRTQAVQACVNREGLVQQSLVIPAPKYHKRYILPVISAGGDSIPNAMPNFSAMNKVKNRATTQMHQAFSAAASAAQTKNKDKQASFRKLRSIARAPSQSARSSSPAQHPRFVPPSDTAIPIKRDKRSDSPIYSTTPLTRSGSLSKKSSLLKTSSVRVQTTSDPKRLVPLRSYADRYNDDSKESEQTLKKSKKFLKSLLSRRKSGKEEPLQDSVP